MRLRGTLLFWSTSKLSCSLWGEGRVGNRGQEPITIIVVVVIITALVEKEVPLEYEGRFGERP